MCKKTIVIVAAICGIMGLVAGCKGREIRQQDESGESSKAGQPQQTPPLLNFTMKLIDGQERSLGDYGNKVIMIVNVASRCGFKNQYAGLQALYEKYKDKGFVILGMPVNDFGGQEPGTNEEIATFCTKKFNVTFDMFAKVHVVADQQCALYKALTSKEHNASDPGPVKWNFEKFLLDREGKLVGRFRSGVAPMSPEIVKAAEAALPSKP